MLLSELKFKDLKHIKDNYYYFSKETVYNVFYVQNRFDKKFIPETVSLKEMLIDLSNRVPIGNNFTEIAYSLPLTDNMKYDAKLLDLEMYYTFKN